MRISELRALLDSAQAQYGDIEVRRQVSSLFDPPDGRIISSGNIVYEGSSAAHSEDKPRLEPPSPYLFLR